MANDPYEEQSRPAPRSGGLPAGTPSPETGSGRTGEERAPRTDRAVWAPSARVTVVLAVAMLAIGIAVGAAVGPAPDASFAGASRVPLLLPSLLAKATGSGTSTSSSAATPGAGSAAEASPATARRRRRHRRAKAAAGAAETPASANEPTASPKTTASAPSKREAAKPLPPITKVWLVELSGSTFSEALSASAAAPYIDTHAIARGRAAQPWSASQAVAFANDAALIATTQPQLVETVVEPTCPEGAAGAQCAAGTPGALSGR